MPISLFKKASKERLAFFKPLSGPHARLCFEYNDFFSQPEPWERHYLKPNTSRDVVTEIHRGYLFLT